MSNIQKTLNSDLHEANLSFVCLSVLARRVMTARKSRNMTRLALCRAANISLTRLALIEAGRYDIDMLTLYRLACELGISPGSLL
ncbi:MAG TPA: helix-turn-helix transcriptional regulator [Oculatellaceae cyanobacterium]